MAEHQQPGNNPLETIREICEEQVFFDEIEFQPLGTSDGALSVVGSSELPALGGEIALTLWRGSKDGRIVQGQESEPTWLRFEGSTDSGDSFQQLSSVDPSDEDTLGLTLPGHLLTPHLLESCHTLLNLLAAAEPTDQGLTGEARERNFEELDEAVQDGFDAADSADDGDEEEMPSDFRLHNYCEGSSFVTIAFGMHKDGDDFTTRAVMPTVAGDVPLSLWLEDESLEEGPAYGLDLKGRRQLLSPDYMNGELDAPWAPSIVQTQIKMSLQYLIAIHETAQELFAEHEGLDPDQVCAAMTMLATNALKEGDPLPLEVYLSGMESLDEGPEWHQAMDEFTEHCKLGFMAGVVVEESLHGNLNIRAVTMDPVTRDYVPLQVFWKEPEDSGEAEHWLSVGSSACPAHTEDESRSELLAGYPQTSKEYIGHAIGHLHDMVHLATDVVNGKTGEVAAALELASERKDVPDVVGGHMMDEAIEDALMGLNGVARLYTGSMDRDVRNS